MKNLARKSLVVLGLMMSLTTFANNAEISFNENEKKVTNVHFKNVEQGSSLVIRDMNGLVLYHEMIQKTGTYSKGFDLSALPDGDYFFELDSELRFKVMPFNVNETEVVFDKNSEESIYKPVLRMKDNMVFVSRTAAEKSPLSYKIYYTENNDLVDQERFDEFEEIKKVYDFAGAKKGNYVFVFESNGRKFSKNINI